MQAEGERSEALKGCNQAETTKSSLGAVQKNGTRGMAFANSKEVLGDVGYQATHERGMVTLCLSASTRWLDGKGCAA